MRTFHSLGARLVRSASLALSTLALCISCLSVPALAQGADAPDSLPSAPSVTSSLANSQTVNHSLTLGERAHVYGRALFSPESIIAPSFGAAIGQWEDAPPGWHQGAEGYGKRFGSVAALHTISQTIRFGFAAVDGEDPRYLLSQDRGIWARTKHAVVSTFVSETSSGTRIPAFSRFAGAYGAAFISNTWYPDNRATAAYAAKRGSTALAGSVGLHLLREFVPLFHRSAQ
jgi:hypothetical protein